MQPLSTRLDDITALGRVMTVWAHPDDESYLAGGLMAIARSNGQPVTCVIATPGDHAASAEGRVRIAATRTRELARAMSVLGVDDVEMLGIRDGECASFDHATASAMIAALVAERRPDTIITFGADGFTGHPDHRAVHRWTIAAVGASSRPVRVLLAASTFEMAAAGREIDERFGVFEPGLPAAFSPNDLALAVELEGEWLDTKVRALHAHHSQTAAVIDTLGETRYRQWVSREVFVSAVLT